MPEIIVKLGDNIVHKYYFDKDVISVGRARDNDIVIENLAVSRNHARIRREDGQYILTDLNSANGSYVNGVRVTKTEVMNDDVITIGKHMLHFINKEMSNEQIISDAFGAERTMIVEKVANAILTITKGKQKDEEFQVTKYETFIGRASDNDIRLHDWFVSKKHAVLVRQGQKFFIRDLGSWRGTLVNGKQIKDAELKDGDTLAFGTTQLEFQMQSEGPALLEGRKPVEMLKDETPDATPAEGAIETPSPPSREPSETSEFVERMAHAGDDQPFEMPSARNGNNNLVDDLVDDLSDDEFSLDDQGEDVIYVGDDDQEPLEDEVQPVEENFIETELVTPEMLAESIGYLNEDELPEEEPSVPEELETKSESEPALQTPPEVAPAYMEYDGSTPVPRQESYVVPDDLPGDVNEKEVRMWLRALTNRSRIVRKQAAKQLKKLTGKSYEWE